jgi:hypothetical protein
MMTQLPDDARRRWLGALGALTVCACTEAPPPSRAPAGDAGADAARIEPQSYRVVLENAHLRVLEFVSRPGMGMCGVGRHSHPPHLTIALSDARVRIDLDGAPSIVADSRLGDVFWSEAETHTTENVGREGARALIVELKPTGAAQGAA